MKHNKLKHNKSLLTLAIQGVVIAASLPAYADDNLDILPVESEDNENSSEQDNLEEHTFSEHSFSEHDFSENHSLDKNNSENNFSKNDFSGEDNSLSSENNHPNFLLANNEAKTSPIAITNSAAPDYLYKATDNKQSITFSDGASLWATEDPTSITPIFNIQTRSIAAVEAGTIKNPIEFYLYSNYDSFIEKVEITVYRGNDIDLVTPLTTITIPANTKDQKAIWDGKLPSDIYLEANNELLYVARAFNSKGDIDETLPQLIKLVKPVELERDLQQERAYKQVDAAKSGNDPTTLTLNYLGNKTNQNALRVQNIPLYGSKIRIYGSDIPANTVFEINGKSYPADNEGKFTAEILEPVGQHHYSVIRKTANQAEIPADLAVNVTGSYHFLVGIADVTVSKNRVSGNTAPMANDIHYENNTLNEARLAFYYKGKIKGKYTVTAQADTHEKEFKDLFTGFLDADPRDIFRRINPENYYPIYGDDSRSYLDTNSQGKLYLRAEWDKSRATFGNFSTGINRTNLAQYNRSLYGADIDFNSRKTTELGESKTQLKAFASQAETASGITKLLGTGGSLYYLRHTDLLPGSEQISLEIIDRTTGRVETTVNLQRGVDYEINELMGRIILTRPLSQITRENVRTLTQTQPLDGFEQLILANYEYYPDTFNPDDTGTGFQGKKWLGDSLALGATYIDERRGGEDYNLKGVDLTLQAGRGTYLKVEHAETRSFEAPIFYSDNGGLSFTERTSEIKENYGSADLVEARINLHELGVTKNDWTAAAWWEDRDAGYSVIRNNLGSKTNQYGAEVLGVVNQNFSILGRYSYAESNRNSLEQSQLTGEWKVTEDNKVGVELRQIKEDYLVGTSDTLLSALSYKHIINDHLDVFGTAQYTLNNRTTGAEQLTNNNSKNNNLLTLGGTYTFANQSTLGATASHGSRGNGAQLNGEYRVSMDHSLYGAYNYTDAKNTRDSVFDTSLQSGWVMGQRWRINNQVSMHNESQFIDNKNTNESGTSHTLGMDFTPKQGWAIGTTVMDAQLDAISGRVNRRAYSVSGAFTNPNTQWSSRLEYRKDTGAEQREQWVTSNRFTQKLNQDWRVALRLNYADTKDELVPGAGAKLAESNLGLSWRPHDNNRWAGFAKYTYLYDVAAPSQAGRNSYDQRSHVFAIEGISRLNDQWEIAAKTSVRYGDYRVERNTGKWLDSRVNFHALQARYHLVKNWDALVEYRWLKVKEGGDKKGWLVGVDRQINSNFKLGAGYNFTEFSDNLTNIAYDQKGWFVNFAGYY